MIGRSCGELGRGCEATQFAVAATSHSALSSDEKGQVGRDEIR